MAKRVVDHLETVKIEEQDGELRALPAIARALISLLIYVIERRAKHTPVREAGQGVFGSQSGHMGFRFPPLCDVGEGLHKAAVGEVSAADFQDGTIAHRALRNRELSCG